MINKINKYKQWYRKTHKNEIKIKKHLFYLSHKKKIKNENRRYYLTHKKQVKITNKLWREKNIERVKQIDKQKHIDDRKRRNKRSRMWYKNHKKYVIERIRLYMLKKRKENISFKLKCNLRCRIYHALKGTIKSLRTMFLIGCEIDYLMYYLQSQFTKGMSWDNYGRGGWVIDHIKPCSKFDLSEPEEQKKCFHYSNLQPLWEKENNIKRNNFIEV